MDIEGFVRARIDDYDYNELADILAVRIREYKKISEENSVEMAKAVIDEVSTTLKLQESDDEFLKEIASVNKADVLMGEMGVGSRGAGDFFVHRKIAEIVSSTNTASLVNPSEQDDGGVVKAQANNDEVYITNIRHKTALAEAYESLKKVIFSIENDMPEDFYSIDLLDAYESLGSITGDTIGEDLVNEIFSKFCMGK